MTEKLAFLKNVYLFRNIPDEHLQYLLKNMEVKRIPRGSDIIREGEEGDSLFILFKGTVTITKKMTLFAENEEKNLVDKSLIRLSASDYAFFGEMAMCGDTDVRSATVTADSDCVLGELPARELKKWGNMNAEFGKIFFQNLAKILADRLRKANRDMLKLTTALTLALEE